MRLDTRQHVKLAVLYFNYSCISWSNDRHLLCCALRSMHLIHPSVRLECFKSCRIAVMPGELAELMKQHELQNFRTCCDVQTA